MNYVKSNQFPIPAPSIKRKPVSYSLMYNNVFIQGATLCPWIVCSMKRSELIRNGHKAELSTIQNNY